MTFADPSTAGHRSRAESTERLPLGARIVAEEDGRIAAGYGVRSNPSPLWERRLLGRPFQPIDLPGLRLFCENLRPEHGRSPILLVWRD